MLADLRGHDLPVGSQVRESQGPQGQLRNIGTWPRRADPARDRTWFV